MALVPIVIENSDRGERSYDIYSRLLRDRIIFINGEVHDQMADLIIAQILFLAAQGPTKDIYMYINSPGGVVTAGMAIYDTMQYVKCDISTICIGQAASMGAFLLAGGTRGKRFSLPNSRIMVHQPSGGMQGQATDMQIAVEEILRMKESLNQLLANNTGRTIEEIRQSTERDNFMSAQQAVEFGIIDEVIEHA